MKALEALHRGSDGFWKLACSFTEANLTESPALQIALSGQPTRRNQCLDAGGDDLVPRLVVWHPNALYPGSLANDHGNLAPGGVRD